MSLNGLLRCTRTVCQPRLYQKDIVNMNKGPCGDNQNDLFHPFVESGDGSSLVERYCTAKSRLSVLNCNGVRDNILE